MAGYDYRANPGAAGELSFYVYDNLNARQDGVEANLYRFDTLWEAVDAFRAVQARHPEWTIALGGSIGGLHELDFIQHRDGANVLVEDYKQLSFWTDREDVANALKTLSVEFLQGPSVTEVQLPDISQPFFDYATSYGRQKR